MRLKIAEANGPLFSNLLTFYLYICKCLLSDHDSSQSLDLVKANILSSSHQSALARDDEDDDLQLALALSASMQTAQDEQRRSEEEQQHSAFIGKLYQNRIYVPRFLETCAISKLRCANWWLPICPVSFETAHLLRNLETARKRSLPTV